MKKNVNIVTTTLKYLSKIKFSVELLNAFFIILFISFIWFLGFVIVDNILHLNIFFRWINLLGFLLFITFYLKKTYPSLKKINPTNTAIEIENKFNFKDQLISAYQLKNSNEYHSYFLENLNKNAEKFIKKVKISDIIDFKKFYINLFKAILPGLIFTLYVFIIPDNFNISFNRFVNPSFRIKQYHKIVKVDIFPKDTVIIEGESIKIELITYGKVKSPKIVFVNQSGVIIKETPNLTGITNITETNKKYIYSFLLQNVYDNFKYYGETIQTRDNIPIKTKEYSIKVVKKPYVKKLRLIYYFPSYTHLKSKIIEDNGHIESVEKTTVKIIGEANNPLKKGKILLKSGRKIPLNINDNKFTGKLFIIRDDEYSILITDIYNHQNINPVKYQILVIKDNPPIVEITRPGMDIEIEESLVVPLEIYAQDDYAVNSLSLYYQIKRAYVHTTPVLKKIEFEIKPSAEIRINHNWDLNKIRISPGDIVEYYAQVWDGYKPQEKHIAKSKKYTIKFPTIEDMYKQLNKEQTQNVISLKELLDEQEEMAKETEKLIKSLERKKELSYIEKKEIEKLKETQEQILKNTKKIVENLKEAARKIEKHKMFAPQMIEKIEQIRNLMNEIADKKMREVMEQLQEAIKKINLTENKKKLLASKLTQEEILKRLDKTLQMLKKLRQQQKIEYFKKQTEELIKKQQELLQKTIDNKFKNKYKPDILASNQNQIKDQFNQFKDEFKKFVKELKQEAPETYKQLKGTLRQMDKSQIDKEMRKSETSLKNSKWNKSINSQRKIISALNNLKADCQKACSGMQQQDITRILNAIDNATFNFLQISYKIEQIKRKIKSSRSIKFEEDKFDFDKNLRPSHLAEKLIFIERSVRYQMKLLENETKEAILFTPEFFKKFDNLFNSLSYAREHLANQRISIAANFQGNALLYINIILKDLLQLKEELKNQAQMQAGANMSDALNQLADAQQKLNELTERLKGQIGKNGLTPELQEYLEELAFQQEMIRKSVNQFLESFKEAGKLLGNLAQAGKEMEDIKKRLKSGKIDKELIRRQKKVLKRLLDSQKALYVKEYSKERKAEVAKEYKVQPPPKLKKEKLKPEEQRYYYYLMEKYPQEYRQLVEDYFKILNTHEEIIYKE